MISFYVSLLQLASSSLLRLGQEVEKEAVKNRESVYLLLDKVRTVTMCFVFCLMKNSFFEKVKLYETRTLQCK